MRSLKKLADLADRFESKLKLSRAQAQVGEDPKAVVADAFFGAATSAVTRGKTEREFQAHILGEGSNFLAALPPTVKTCNIGASVDGPAKTASFLVTCSPPTNTANILKALVADYTKFYGKDPNSQFAARLAAGDIKPPTVKASHPSIIQVT